MTGALQGYLDGIRLPLPPGEEDPDPRAARYRPELSEAVTELYRSITTRTALDSLTTEVVRLRCARYNNCRMCQSVRLGAAVRSGLDQSLDDKIDRYEDSDLDERHKVALRLADAFITQPGTIDEHLRADLERWFSRAEIVELLLDLASWLRAKIYVTLSLDIPYDPESDDIGRFEFSAAGNAVVERR